MIIFLNKSQPLNNAICKLSLKQYLTKQVINISTLIISIYNPIFLNIQFCHQMLHYKYVIKVRF